MYSTKVLGNGGNEITNHSFHKSALKAAVKAKKPLEQKSAKK